MGTGSGTDIQRAQGRRLEAARKRIPGCSNKARGADYLKVNRNTYYGHENGNRGIDDLTAEDYANKLGVPAEWILFGRNPPEWATPDFGNENEQTAAEADHFLQAWREHRKMSVADLADAAGVEPQLVAAWEQGSAEISDKRLRRLSALLGTTPGAILDVDPGSIAPHLLELWIEAASQQKATRLAIIDLRRRTGTQG